MPVTIRTTDMKYKDSQGNYVGINGVAERTTAEMVADVEAAGADTIADVQQAIADSQAALNGIDAQRNTMIAAIASVAGQGTDTTFTQSGVAADAAEVGKLKSALLYRPVNYIDENIFVKGSLNDSGENDTWMATARMRTPIIYALNDIKITTDIGTYSTAAFVIHYFNSNGQHINNTGWKTGITIPKGTIFRVLCSLTPNAATEKTVSEIYAGFVFHSIIPAVKDPFLLDTKLQFFEKGSIGNAGQNDTWYGNARARTIDKIISPYDIIIHRKQGAYTITYYNSDDSFRALTKWISTDRMIPANTKFRLCITKNQNSSAYVELAEIVDCIEISDVREKQYSKNPNIILQCRNVDDTAYPPYTKWYVQAAAKNQYDRVRFNVRKTTDGYYFLCHDNTINAEARNSDGTTISSSISANGQTLETLNSYDWGIKYGAYYSGIGVPMLDDALKYSALFNMGVTLEISSLTNWTDEDTFAVLAMCDKYGVTDNLIIIDPIGIELGFLKKWVDYNNKISAFVGAVADWWTDTNIARVKQLQTEHNKVFVQLYPWGSAPTTTFINMAKSNSFVLYSSIPMSEAQLLNTTIFESGYSLIEANNVYMIKDTIRNWADSLV